MNMEARFPMQSVMHNITLNVTITGVRTWRLRQALGMQLLKLAALVMGVGLFVDLEQED